MGLRHIGLAVMATILALVPAAGAMAQQQDTDLPDAAKDPRDRLTPPGTRHSPNRTNPRVGGNGGIADGNSSSPAGGSPGSVVQGYGTPTRSSASVLETMGSMVLYQAPAAAGDDAPLSSLPGMASYTPPSADEGSGVSVSYPAWWPK